MVNLEYLDYLQRTGAFALSNDSVPLESHTNVPPENRRSWKINGIGCLEKQTLNNRERLHLATEDVLIGLYGYKIPLAFMTRGESSSISIHFGNWDSSEKEKDSLIQEKLSTRQKVIKSM